MAKLNMSEDKDFDLLIKQSLQQQADSDAPVLTDDLISRTMNRIHEEAKASGQTTTPFATNPKKRRHYVMPALTTAACLLLLGGVIFTLAKNGVFLSNESTKNSSDTSFDMAETTEATAENDTLADFYDSGASEIYDSESTETSDDSVSFEESTDGFSEEEAMLEDSEEDSMMDEPEEDMMTEDSTVKDFTPNEEISGSQKPLYENEKADFISNFSFASYFSGREEKRPELIQILTSDSETIYHRGTKKYNRIYRQLNEELYEYRDEAYEEVTLTEVLTDYQKKILLFYPNEEEDYYTEVALYIYEDVLYVLPDDYTTYDLTTLTPSVKVRKYCRQDS